MTGLPGAGAGEGAGDSDGADDGVVDDGVVALLELPLPPQEASARIKVVWRKRAGKQGIMSFSEEGNRRESSARQTAMATQAVHLMRHPLSPIFSNHRSQDLRLRS